MAECLESAESAADLTELLLRPAATAGTKQTAEGTSTLPEATETVSGPAGGGSGSKTVNSASTREGEIAPTEGGGGLEPSCLLVGGTATLPPLVCGAGAVQPLGLPQPTLIDTTTDDPVFRAFMEKTATQMETVLDGMALLQISSHDSASAASRERESICLDVGILSEFRETISIETRQLAGEVRDLTETILEHRDQTQLMDVGVKMRELGGEARGCSARPGRPDEGVPIPPQGDWD
jgi:hypothetical protein